MSTASSTKPKRSHASAKLQGLTRIGVHESVLKTVQRAVDRIRKTTGKRLRPGELLDWLAEAEDTLVAIGTNIAKLRPVEVSVDVQAAHTGPFVSVVNGPKQPSAVGSTVSPSPALTAKKTHQRKKKDITGTESLPGLE